MMIVVNHKISDVNGFWQSAKESLPNLPEGIKIHQVMPAPGMATATCVWEANSIDHLRDYLNGKVANFCVNDYMEVDMANAMGLAK